MVAVGRTLLLVMLGLGLLGAQATRTVLLRYRLEPGQTSRFRLVVTQESALSADGKAGAGARAKIRIEADLVQKVLGPAEGGSATVEWGIERALLTQTVGRAKLPAPDLAGAQKVRLTATLGARGELSGPQIQDPTALDPTARALAEALRRALAQLLLTLPEPALMVGEGWTGEREVPLGLPGGAELKLKTVTRHKLAGIDKVWDTECAKIRSELTLAVHGEVSLAGVLTRADLEGTGTCAAVFALSGELLSAQAELQLEGDTRAGSSDQAVQTHLAVAVKLELVPR